MKTLQHRTKNNPKYYSLPSSSHKTCCYVSEIQIIKKPRESTYKNLLSFSLPSVRYWQVRFNLVTSPRTEEYISVICCIVFGFQIHIFTLSQPTLNFCTTSHSASEPSNISVLLLLLSGPFLLLSYV